VRSRAVLRTAHPTSVLSHQSALAEWEVPLWGVSLDQTDLTRTDGKAGRREAGVAHHRARLADDEWTVRDGVPVVEPARATIEVIVAHPPEVGLVVACGVLSKGLASDDQLQAAAARAEYWPNSLHARIVLARADGRLASLAEARTWHLFHAHHIPRPEPQVKVHDEWGVLIGIVDFLWREQGVFLEFDGRIKYLRFRRKGESLEEYLMREKRREEQICLVTGWVCLRITWADLQHPVRTARRIRRVLESRTEPAA
jgi:very-short-patch-repair endonuclease